ncbi:ROK family protein [Pararhodospirillum photometricum]|uniref:N-acetylglucosamine kinase n=1 Tax=Pararhodospirillum photometricum DSM 122 TaxID=1150469 RepID=H6SQ39_PARPM|nr:ROK family protein [Pararhodospirillum photometricum]CCG07309.1 N-acetylglucosamine kinase [Pararhodospirillum photometricum DSM 122]
MGLRFGIDLGGTKIEIVALTPDGQECLRRRIPTPRHDYPGTLAAITALVTDAEVELGQRAPVGVAIPGAISPATGLVKNANSTWLNGRALDKDLAACLGRPVRLANDADCFALSEAHDGAATGAATVFGVILGTGVGAGVVVNGRLLQGPNAIAGEWGHMPLPWPTDGERPGPACYCGRQGCVETFCSGPGMAADHALHTGQTASAQEIAQAAEAGDRTAQATLERHAHRLARALAVVIDLLDPHVIVLGGGVGAMPHLTEVLPRLWAPLVFSDAIVTRVVRPRHGDSSGVRGAAWLWPSDPEMKGR